MFRIVLLCFFGLYALSLSAQLQRKVQLGARLAYVTEDGAAGCKVLQVVQGTSVALKLQENDLILKIGQSSFSSVDEFIHHFLQYSAGEEVRLTVLRAGKTLELSAAALSRPLETDDNASVIYDAADYKGGQLRVIINKPLRDQPMPAMLFIPGYTCSSMDGLTDDHPYKRIIDAYVDAGYVTLRIEKSGLGDSKDTPPCES